ncbi:MAG: hypothetical protein II888_06680 [Clostridia bacterium]|nr:hypothetical protein [Clostridia bacterium]
MNRRKIALGPGASSLILIAVVLALSVLTVLTMISARSDEALTARSIETRSEVYGLFAQAERSLARLDAVLVECLKENPENADAYLTMAGEKLPEGMRMEEDRVLWTEKSEKRALECGVRILFPGEDRRTEWINHSLGAEDIWEEDESDFDDFEDSGEEEALSEEWAGENAEEDPAPAEEEGEEIE